MHGPYTITKTGERCPYLADKKRTKVTSLEIALEGYAPRTVLSSSCHHLQPPARAAGGRCEEQVKHMQYGEWPDRGVPAESRAVLKVLK